MQNKIQFKTIEDIAIQYIINTTNSDNNFEDTINTVKDPKISIKGCNSIGGSFFCRTNKFLENENYIFFRKIPQKTLSDDELLSFNTETEDSTSKNTIYNSSTVIRISHTKMLVKNCKNIKYSKKLFFPLKYDLVYDCLSELYLPLITNLEDLNNLRSYLFDTKKKVEYFSSHESIHEKNNNLLENIITSSSFSKKIEEFLEEEKCCEIIEFSLILFIIHLMFGAKIQFTEFINEEDIETIYGEVCFVLHKMLENIMLKLLFNENYNKINKKNNDNKKKQNNSISFESVCSRYVKDYFKGMEKSQNKIINDLNANMGIIFQRLYNAVNILMINFTKVKIYTKNVDNPDQIESYFLNLLDFNYNKSDNNEININENDDDINNSLEDENNINNDNKNNFKNEDENNINNENKNINNEDDNNINNENNDNINNDKIKEVLQKEFIDQFECFKMMFFFLTQKEIKNNDINLDNNKKLSTKKILLKYKNNNETPYKNGTYTSLNKLLDPTMEEKSQNSYNKPKGELTEKIKNNLTNSLKTNKTNNNIILPLTSEEINSSFYFKLKNYFNLYYSNFVSLLEKNKVKPPFLPKLDTQKYKYTLVLDLDETLVHYIEEENSAYVQVRPYADYFLKELSKDFEIVLFTAAEEDYTDIVLKELNKNNYISHVLCRKYTELNNNSYIKDLSKLGRDLSKVCIVDNNKDNFCLQPENGLFISSYFGEPNDNELFLLCSDLKKIIEKQPDDIRTVIKEIDVSMQKRYAENMYVIQ